MKILCIIPCLANEPYKYKESLLASTGRLSKCFGSDIHFVAIIQPNTNASSDLTENVEASFFKQFNNFSVVNLTYRSVSKARNIGIDFAEKHQFTHIYFHDVSIELTESTCAILKSDGMHPSLAFSFQAKFVGANTTDQLKKLSKPSKALPLYKPYVWTYIIPLKLIADLRFNEDFGPGDGTNYKSGEDLLFLYEILIKTDFSVIENNSAIAFHPPREKNYTKHLNYAKGQGLTLRLLINKHKRISDLIYCFLFFGNAIFRCLFLKQNSIKILKNRASGFFLSSINSIYK